jgi:DNA-binding NarL/FixJ family response regulator
LDFKATISTTGEDKKVEYPVLTHREKEILRSIIEGQSNKEISHTLYVSVETVKSHIKSIYHKLQVKNRVEAVTVAIKQNVLPQNGIPLN